MAAIRNTAGAIYRWLMGIYVLAVVVQFFLAGAGVFGEKHGPNAAAKLSDETSWDLHRGFGTLIAIAGLVLLVVCLAWWSERIWLMWTFMLALLGAVQFLLASAGDHHRWIGALHPLNAVAILGLSAFLAHRAWRRDLKGR